MNQNNSISIKVARFDIYSIMRVALWNLPESCICLKMTMDVLICHCSS